MPQLVLLLPFTRPVSENQVLVARGLVLRPPALKDRTARCCPGQAGEQAPALPGEPSPPFRYTFILFRSECGRSDVCNAHPCCPVVPGNALKATPGVQRGCACCHFCRGCFSPGGPRVVDQEPCSAAVGAWGRGRNRLLVPSIAAQTHA